VSSIPGATRAGIKLRDFDRCVRCGAFGTEIQHRVRRREGGHAPSNLVLMCHFDHQTWAHANPAAAREVGIIVPTWASPDAVPVKTWQGWLLLDDSYNVTHLTEAEAERFMGQIV
jgi:hypothetical protein